MRHALAVRIGARGTMLLILSAIWARLFAWPIIAGRATEGEVFYFAWPESVRVGLWAITIALALTAALTPPRKDWFGWIALTVMPLQRLTAWSWAGITGAVPADLAIDQAILYVLIIAVVITAAAMRPPEYEPSEHPDG